MYDLPKRAQVTSYREGDLFIVVLTIIKAKKSDTGRYTCHPNGVDILSASQFFPSIYIFISCKYLPSWTILISGVWLTCWLTYRERSCRCRTESFEKRLRRNPCSSAICRSLLQPFPVALLFLGGLGAAEKETVAIQHFVGIGSYF